jgi:hypothetical protein
MFKALFFRIKTLNWSRVFLCSYSSDASGSDTVSAIGEAESKSAVAIFPDKSSMVAVRSSEEELRGAFVTYYGKSSMVVDSGGRGWWIVVDGGGESKGRRKILRE